MAEATDTHGPSLPRVIALALAVGAAFWGGLLLLAFGPAALFPVPFGVGYAVLAGYVVRAASCPALEVRRLIWAASIAVQGGWLCVGLADGLDNAIQKPVTPLWWACATVGSVVALLAERPDKGAPGQALPRAGGA